MSYPSSFTQSQYHTPSNSWRNAGLGLTHGRYAGRSLYWVMLKDMSYIRYCCSNVDCNGLFYKEVRRLKAIMDAMYFVRNCRCGISAIQCSFHTSHPVPKFWCGSCNPLASATPAASLSVCMTYDDVCNAFVGKPRRIGILLRKAIRELRESKGYTGNLTMKKAQNFFEQSAHLLQPGA